MSIEVCMVPATDIKGSPINVGSLVFLFILIGLPLHTLNQNCSSLPLLYLLKFLNQLANSSEYTHFVSEEVEQYETPEGPVEQRNTFYNSYKIVVDPQTGLGMTVTIPELQIDIQIDLDALEVDQLTDDQ